MWPEILRVAGLEFTLYDAMRALAVTASAILCVWLNRLQGISLRNTLLIAAICIPVSIGSARCLNAIEYGATLSNLVPESVRNSGSSIYGALIACTLLILTLTKILHIPTLRFLDAAAPAIALGEAVSRFGCFCAGCCYGERWNGPWSVVFPGESFAAQDQRRRGILDSRMTDSLPVHPVQIYGVILMTLLTWLLVRHFRKQHRDGDIFFLLLIGYGTYRLAITPLRVETLTSMKMFSILFIIAGIIGMLQTRRSTRAT